MCFTQHRPHLSSSLTRGGPGLQAVAVALRSADLLWPRARTARLQHLLHSVNCVIYQGGIPYSAATFIVHFFLEHFGDTTERLLEAARLCTCGEGKRGVLATTTESTRDTLASETTAAGAAPPPPPPKMLTSTEQSTEAEARVTSELVWRCAHAPWTGSVVLPAGVMCSVTSARGHVDARQRMAVCMSDIHWVVP